MQTARASGTYIKIPTGLIFGTLYNRTIRHIKYCDLHFGITILGLM